MDHIKMWNSETKTWYLVSVTDASNDNYKYNEDNSNWIYSKPQISFWKEVIYYFSLDSITITQNK